MKKPLKALEWNRHQFKGSLELLGKSTTFFQTNSPMNILSTEQIIPVKALIPVLLKFKLKTTLSET